MDNSIADAFAPLVLLEPLLIFLIMTSVLSSLSLILFVASISKSVTNVNYHEFRFELNSWRHVRA